jgi:hypothetical protein
MIHFVASLIIDLRMQREVFSKLTLIVSESASIAFESSSTSDANIVQRRLQEDLPLKINQIKKEVLDSWTPYSYLLSFPTESFMGDFWQNVHAAWVYSPYTGKEITKEQQSHRERIINILQRAFNSFGFGIVVCLFLAPICFFQNEVQSSFRKS